MGKLKSATGVIRPKLNTSEILLWAYICPIGPLKCQKILSSKINVIWVFEISWFPWQPIMPTVKIGGIHTKKYSYLNNVSS